MREGGRLLGAAADHVTDQHADAEGDDQRGGKVVLHELLGLLGGIARAVPGVPPLPVGDLAEGSGEVLEIGPHIVELIVDAVDVQLLQIPARLCPQPCPNSS